MDGHKPADAVTDAALLERSALDREIESLVAVDPSPEFLARVRARVAEETPRASWFRWELAAAAASVAIVVVAAATFWPSNEPSGSLARVEATQPSRVVEGLTPASVAATHASPVTTHTSRPQRASVESINVEPSGPVALIAPEDGRAFDRLLASIRTPDVVLVLNEDPSGPEPIETPWVAIDPIVIESLPAVAVLEGGVE
jgi:hypothetical protein